MAFLRTGIIASTIANVNRDPDKSPQPFTPQDFMPDGFKHIEAPREVTLAEREKAWLDDMRVLVAMNGGTDMTEGAR